MSPRSEIGDHIKLERQLHKAFALLMTLREEYPGLDDDALLDTLLYFDDRDWEHLRRQANKHHRNVKPTASDTSCTVSLEVKGLIRNMLAGQLHPASLGDDTLNRWNGTGSAGNAPT